MRVSVVFAAAFALSCAVLSGADPAQVRSDPVPDAPRLSAAEAINIALAELPRMHIDTDKYDTPTASFTPNSNGGIWLVYFHDKRAALDGCFFLQVDDRTRKVLPRVPTCS
jgi:hypothetical protein